MCFLVIFCHVNEYNLQLCIHSILRGKQSKTTTTTMMMMTTLTSTTSKMKLQKIMIAMNWHITIDSVCLDKCSRLNGSHDFRRFCVMGSYYHLNELSIFNNDNWFDWIANIHVFSTWLFKFEPFIGAFS